MAMSENSMEEISSEDLDPNFKYEIEKEPGGENFMRCFQCGTCTGGCPIHSIDPEYNCRKIIRMALLGLREEVLRSKFIWFCSTCYTCYERCPQDVKITEVMNALKNMAVREGFIHPSFQAQIDALEKHGRLIEISEFEERIRAKAGLNPILDSSGEVQKIFKITALKKVVEK
jgi:heterodisulfide reductase subunit C